MEKRKIVRGIILAVLLVCAVFLIYSILVTCVCYSAARKGVSI